ncbi:unnamed protein product [Camellia sinensis]
MLDEAEFSKFHSGVKRGDIVGVIGYPAGEEIIVVIPRDEWWELSLRDESKPQVVLLPLHPDVRAKLKMPSYCSITSHSTVHDCGIKGKY